MTANTKRLTQDLEHAMNLLQLGFYKLTEGHCVTVSITLVNGSNKGIQVSVFGEDGNQIADGLAQDLEEAMQECVADCLTQFDTEESDKTFWP